ncbi:MAG: hypothetical protein K940chlam3_01379 [Chlamydiae bacterium]|nr:hypothetical protein [Chlamydiota bacterium]
MNRFLWICLLPVALWSQTIQPPVEFHKGPMMEVDQQIRDEWMDGPKALAKEAVRNEEIFEEHQFPAIQVLIALILITLIILVIIFHDTLFDWIKKKWTKQLSPREIALEKIKQADQLENLSDRYNLLNVTLKETLEEEYRFPATESTHEEVLIELAKQKMSKKDQIGEIFHEIGAVQYQHEAPTIKDYQKIKSTFEKLLK